MFEELEGPNVDPSEQQLLFSCTGCHLRGCYSAVSLLPCCVPYLSLDRLPINLNASCCKLYSNGAFALQVKLIASESRQEVTLAYSRVSNEHNYKKEMTELDSRCTPSIDNHLQWAHSFSRTKQEGRRIAKPPLLSQVYCPRPEISREPELPHSPACWTDFRLDF